MAPELPSREAAVRTLVAALDDAVLARAFPDHAPAAMRLLLVGEPAASGAVETPAPSGPARATATMGRCRLFTDGASRGNPGEAGAGAVLCDAAGGELAARSAYLKYKVKKAVEFISHFEDAVVREARQRYSGLAEERVVVGHVVAVAAYLCHWVKPVLASSLVEEDVVCASHGVGVCPLLELGEHDRWPA